MLEVAATLQVTGFVANAPIETSQPWDTTLPQAVRRTSVGWAARCTTPVGDSSVIRIAGSHDRTSRAYYSPLHYHLPALRKGSRTENVR